MKYVIVDTTDGKYKGMHLELDRLPVRGEYFTVKDFTYEVIEVVDGEKIYGTNYVTVLEEAL